jgi:pentatricopeptide repeat protein
MKNEEGMFPTSITFTCILVACGRLGKLSLGERIHKEVVVQNLLKDRGDIRLMNALLDMYARCGHFEKALEVIFELGAARNKVSWNALIAAYSQRGLAEEALDCLELMRQDGISPDEITFTCILKACGSMAAFDRGKEIHDEIDKQGLLLGTDIVLGTALVDMYARCGALPKAYEVLQKLPGRSVITWNALISGYAQQGQGKEAMACFEQMLSEKLDPNIVTFLCLLNACSHSGLVEEGETWFVNMGRSHGMVLDSEHYTCIVDTFGRAGHLDKAVMAITRMPCSNHPPVWTALLDACRKWGYVDLGRLAFENASQFHSNDAHCTLMSNIYAASNMKEDAERVRASRVEMLQGLNPGNSECKAQLYIP